MVQLNCSTQDKPYRFHSHLHIHIRNDKYQKYTEAVKRRIFRQFVGNGNSRTMNCNCIAYYKLCYICIILIVHSTHRRLNSFSCFLFFFFYFLFPCHMCAKLAYILIHCGSLNVIQYRNSVWNSFICILHRKS